MPQIDQVSATFLTQLFWLVLTFGAVYFTVGRSMVPKIQATMEMRKKRVEDDMEEARLAHARADEMEEEYRKKIQAMRDEANGITNEAKAKAAEKSERRLHDADKRVMEKIARAEAVIQEQRDAALKEVEAVAVEATSDIVARLTKANISGDMVATTVKGVMAHD